MNLNESNVYLDLFFFALVNEQIKLSGPNNITAGTVSVNINGNWDTLCDTDFGNEEARVICRELGYWYVNVI